MKHIYLGAAGLAVLLLAGCGRGDDNPNQPSADERQALDNIAAKRDAEAETFDTSADSLVPAEGTAIEGNGIAPNSTAPVGNRAVPTGNSVNQAGPR